MQEHFQHYIRKNQCYTGGENGGLVHIYLFQMGES